MIDLLFIVVGFALLFFGGDGLVRGCVTIAEKMKLSTLLVSAVVVGFSTSMPELLVSVQAGLKGHTDIALGNVIGSNICNTLLILGVAAVAAAIPCKSAQIRRDIFMGVAAGILLAVLSLNGTINGFVGLVMLATLASYVSYGIWLEKRKNGGPHGIPHDHIAIDGDGRNLTLGGAIFMAVASLVLLLLGAHFLVDGAVSAAHDLGVPESVIGLTLVALGTSLPELATAYIAARRKHTGVVIGNILGSNLFNILGILGIAALIKPLHFSGQISPQDAWIMAGVMALLIPLTFTRSKIGKIEGAGLLLLYVSYILWLYFFKLNP